MKISGRTLQDPLLPQRGLDLHAGSSVRLCRSRDREDGKRWARANGSMCPGDLWTKKLLRYNLRHSLKCLQGWSAGAGRNCKWCPSFDQCRARKHSVCWQDRLKGEGQEVANTLADDRWIAMPNNSKVKRLL